MAKADETSPLEALRRIKRLMRPHWLETLAADLATVEQALSRPPQGEPGESLPILDEDEPEGLADQRPEPKGKPRK
jgi:hypothetical protein